MLFFFFKPLAAILPGGQSAGRQECESGGGLRQRWLGGALAPVTSAGLQQRSARHRHGRHRGQYTAVRWQPRTTPARHSQLASLLPRAVLTRDSSQTPFNTAKNQFNQQRERERANRAADISQRSKLVNPIRIKTQKAK